MPQTTASELDMSFLDDGQTAATYSGIAAATDAWGAQLSAHIDELSRLSDGETVSAAMDQLAQTREGLSAGGYALAASSSALAAQKAANDRWRSAPQDDELEAAQRAITQARQELAASDARSAAAAEGKLRAALEHSKDLNERRRQADQDFVDSSGKVQGRLREFNPEEGKNKKGKRKEGVNDHETPGKKPELKAHASPAPSNHRAPAAPGAPGAAPATPSTSASSAGGGPSPADTAALSALLQRNGQIQPTQPAQQPQQQPQTAPAAASPSSATSPGSTPKSKVDGAITADDVPGIAAPVPMPVSPPTGPAPAATAPAQPSTSGSSAPNLSTDSNVSGRPEGARSAFNQPHTAASGATGAAIGAGTGTGTALNPKGMQAAAGMPAAGMPFGGMPAAPGAAGGGRGGSVKPVQAHQNNIVYEEGVVPGGTIAQNRPNFDDKT
ncbi:hypothetical protein [Mycobacteroides abscessus]|uniref:hypothetical protein n=1 Tax=Mycobacteroides abscessus TaxID=36809 RepID=UPI0005E9E453|nr:hypothetical protein [Mycobacteroides abscessus]CPW71519.1 Uncharacterised protein [Mycobacteroides abscessus]SKF62114.1 Uncharacterised protein [Mycobacteroides abscessus subsp. bolletii]SKH91801.1 Uncharacterised protein [Mycobacteroides abscessus subsp. bolletii]